MAKKKSTQKTTAKKGPSMQQKRIEVLQWLHSSFVDGGSICDANNGTLQGTLDKSHPFPGISDYNGILYQVDDFCKTVGTKGAIDEFYAVLTVLYAVKKGIRLAFTKSGLLEGHDDTSDELFGILYNVTMATKGDKYRFKDVLPLYKMVSKMEHEEYLRYYPGFLEAVKNKCKALHWGTVAMPKYFISKTIGDIVRQHGCKSVYNPFAGAGGLILGLDPDVEYVGQEPYGAYAIFARLVADANGIGDPTFMVSDPVAEWSYKEYDAVICNLPTDCYFDDYENYLQKGKANDDLHEKVFNFLLEKRTARKLAVVLVRFPFLVSYQFRELRRRLFEEGRLESVICLPEDGVFSDSHIKTAIIVLDFEHSHDAAEFYRGEYAVLNRHSAYTAMKSGGYNLIDETPDFFHRTVTRAPLEFMRWKYVAALYANPVGHGEGEKVMAIEDIADIVPVKESTEKSGLVATTDCFREQPLEAVITRNKFQTKSFGCLSCPAEAEGPCVLFRVMNDGGIGACMLRKGEKVNYSSFNTYALKPKEDRVTLEYLTYALVSCPEFNHYLTDCIEYNADDRVLGNAIALGKLPIPADLAVQKQFIGENSRLYLVEKDRTFNVIWASDIWKKAGQDKKVKGLLDQYTSMLSQSGISVISTPATAAGLADELKLHVDECTSAMDRADAVILDASIPYRSSGGEDPFDGLDYAIDLKDDYAKHNIPFYLFGECKPEAISKHIKKRRLEYFESRFFGQSAPQLERLVFKFLDEMDVLGSREAELRRKYAAVFNAADRYGRNNVQKVLSEALSEEYSQDLTLKETEEKLTKLRVIAEGMLKDLAKKDIIPALTFGQQVIFLDKCFFDDTANKDKSLLLFYRGEKRLMPTTLSAAFQYFRKLVSGSAHDDDDDKMLDVQNYIAKVAKNSDLYKSAVYILMDLLLWYSDTLDKAEKEPESVVGTYTTVPNSQQKRTGVVQEDEDGTLYCDHVRLKPNRNAPALKAGDRVEIDSCRVTNRPTANIWFDSNNYRVLAEE